MMRSSAGLFFALLLFACPQETTGPPDPPPVALDWTLVAPAVTEGAVFSIWGPSETDLWAVGGEVGRPLALRFDGTSWSHDEPPGADQQLWWVHGAGDAVMVVGDAGSAFVKRGTTWSELNGAPAGTVLYGVWMASASDAWAVGGPVFQPPVGVDKAGDVVMRFDGTNFTQVDVPVLKDRTGQRQLFKVWGSAADDVFIVGSEGLILHWDGAAWRIMESGVTSMLFTVIGRAADDVWAVGGGAAAVLLHYDGTGWTSHELPEYTPQILQGVWTAPEQDLLVSGYFGFTARLRGEAWEVPDPVTSNPLHTVFGDSSGRFWAAGGDIAAAKLDYTGVVVATGTGIPVYGGADTDAGPTDVNVADASDDGGGEGVSDASADVGPVDCNTPDTACPADVPHAGAPCTFGLECTYDTGDRAMTVHTALCVGGVWGVATDCTPAPGGGCGVPPLFEACLDPFAGTIAGASIEVGPAGNVADAFVPFQKDQMVELIWGGQGSPMFAFRISAQGADELTCANVHATISIDGTPTVDATQPVVFRCGETLSAYVIVPAYPIDCEMKVFTFEVVVEIPGVGSTTTTVQVQGGEHCFG